MAGYEPRPESVALLDKLVAALKSRGIVTEEEITRRRTAAASALGAV